MKRLLFILMAAVMLSGCAAGAGADVPRKEHISALITDAPLKDYDVTGSIEVYGVNSYTKYVGAVSGEAAADLWELLLDIEQNALPIRLEGRETVGEGDGGIGGRLLFADKDSGDCFMVTDGILYEAPGLCGGSRVLCIGGRYYGDGELNGVVLSERIKELLIRGVAREENIIEHTVCESTVAQWEDKPEKLTDLDFDTLEFSGKASVFDPETRITTDYQGNIADESCAELWAVLKAIEECEPIDLGEKGSVGGGCFNGCLWITDTVTGDEYCVCDGIYYSDPYLDGGPTVIDIMGRFRDGSCDKYYFPVCVCGDNGYSTYDRFKDILCEGLVREENVYARVLPSEPIIIEKKDIVLVHSYCNWAEGHQHYGEFVDLAGNVYWFDLSEAELNEESDEWLIKVIEDGHFSGEFGDPTDSVKDIDALWEIVGLADNVAEDAEIVETHRAYDAGQDTIYAVNSEHRLVEVYSEGDYDRVNTDENAAEILAIQRRIGILQ